MKAVSGIGLGLIWTFGLVGHAIAEEVLSAERNGGTLSLVYENDWVDGGKDRNYTNGIRLSYISGAEPGDGVSKWLSRNLMGNEEQTLWRWGLALGHSIFTPNDIKAKIPNPNDHPYAGWLYGEYILIAAQRDKASQFTFRFGMVGPSAGGEWVQNEVHKLIGADTADGWDYQIKDEPGIVISYDRRLRAVWETGDYNFGMDITPSAGVTLGNVQTNARIGVMARVGRNMKTDYDYGPARIRPALAGAGFVTPIDTNSWYLFAGVEGRYVAHDIFLDGSLFRDGPGVGSRPFVGDLQAGFVVQVRDTQFAFTYVERTPEFDGQNGAHRFGAFTLSRTF